VRILKTQAKFLISTTSTNAAVKLADIQTPATQKRASDDELIYDPLGMF